MKVAFLALALAVSSMPTDGGEESATLGEMARNTADKITRKLGNAAVEVAVKLSTDGTDLKEEADVRFQFKESLKTAKNCVVQFGLLDCNHSRKVYGEAKKLGDKLVEEGKFTQKRQMNGAAFVFKHCYWAAKMAQRVGMRTKDMAALFVSHESDALDNFYKLTDKAIQIGKDYVAEDIQEHCVKEARKSKWQF